MILDANIVIAYLAGEEVVVDKLSEWRQRGFTLFLPSVAEAEVLSFSNWTSAERYYTEEFIAENFTSIPFDRALARLAGRIRAESGLRFPDAAIAAAALSKWFYILRASRTLYIILRASEASREDTIIKVRSRLRSNGIGYHSSFW